MAVLSCRNQVKIILTGVGQHEGMWRTQCPNSILVTSFGSPSADSRRAVVSYWRKYVHLALVQKACLTPGFESRSGHLLSYYLTLIQEEQCSVTGEGMCP